MNRNSILQVAVVLILGGIVGGQSAEVAKAPVPKSPYLSVVYRYADTMLKLGRDAYGPQKTGLFLSALDRTTLAPLTNRPPAPRGLFEWQRAGARGEPLVGANLQHDENFLRLLYTLSELSGKPAYREAADAQLKWFLENAPSKNTHLLPWGAYLSWNVITDRPVDGRGVEAGGHQFFRPWMLWDRCFAVAPEASRQFSQALWDHHIANHETGGFNAHAGFFRHEALDAMDYARDAGIFIRTWAAAYAHTRDQQFLRSIEVLLTRFEKKQQARNGHIELRTGEGDHSRTDWALSLAIDCAGAAHHLPEPLATRLRAFVARGDEAFCSLAHDLKSQRGFVVSLPGTLVFTQPWADGYGLSTAQIGMMCVSRYDNSGKTGYRKLIFSAADQYLSTVPAKDEDACPLNFGHAISLQLAAWRHSADWKYMERARQLGDVAVEKFWGTNALPKASFKAEHYEAVTGADTLALALLELHLNILHITAVRCPPNTIDR